MPLAGSKKNETELLKISRRVTVLWGAILIIAALAFIGLQGTVVEVALGIASYTYGGLLGVFLLGLISKNAAQRDAITGFITALIVMTVIVSTIQIAWPLYTLVGSLTTIITGTLISRIGKKSTSS
jgi:Na+/pantothenate symporter